MPIVSIIIVNWNGLQHLPTCLDSLASQLFRDFETIVVDNGSTDGSVALVRESYPWVRLVTLAALLPGAGVIRVPPGRVLLGSARETGISGNVST